MLAVGLILLAATQVSPEQRQAGLRNLQGLARLEAGEIAAAIEDFDAYLKVYPERKPYHWQRGIALYYAGRYDDGRRQFELHQTVNPNDVENAVWRYLCQAKVEGVKKAQADLLKIEADARVPMTEIYELFAGRKTADDVLAAAEAGSVDPDERRLRRFYARLYLGLYDDAAGETATALKHLQLATGEVFVLGSMGEIAKLHLARLEKQLEQAPGAKKP